VKAALRKTVMKAKATENLKPDYFVPMIAPGYRKTHQHEP